MNRASNAGCGHVDLAGIGLGIGNEFRDSFGRKGWIDLHDERRTGDASNRRRVANEIEFEIVVERCVNGVRRRGHKKCVAIWTRPYDHFSGEIRAGARLVFDDKLLPEPLR